MQSDLHPEPLTDRELDVLRFLDTDLSNAQIADKLFVERSTVRYHLKNIYAKLGVSSREEAVKRARDLNLLQDDVPEIQPQSTISTHSIYRTRKGNRRPHQIIASFRSAAGDNSCARWHG